METALPLLLNAVNQGRLTVDDIANKYYHNPKRILGLRDDYGNGSYIEVNLDKSYVIRNEDLVTRAGWTPFNGCKVKGSVERVVLNGSQVYASNKFSEIDDMEKYRSMIVNCNTYKKPVNELKQDIVYIDAPWSGPDYKKEQIIDLYLSDISIDLRTVR